MLSRIDAPVKLVIAGNHDLSLDKEWLKKNPNDRLDMTLDERKALWQEATDLWYSEDGRAMKEGVQMLDEGVHTIPLKNGAQLTVKLELPCMSGFVTAILTVCYRYTHRSISQTSASGHSHTSSTRTVSTLACAL